MIYFIQCGENGPIKIGQSDNPEDRMAQLQTACPYELKMIWIYKEDAPDEAWIHEAFSHERIRGEWFHPSPGLFTFIRDELSNSHEIELVAGGAVLVIDSYDCGIEISSQDFILMRPGNEIYINSPLKIVARGGSVEVV